MSEKNEIPIFKCFPRDEGIFFLKFWCPFCKKWHQHGMGAGHRAAHCHTPNLQKTGYIVKPYTKAELLNLRKLIDMALEYGAYGKRYEKEVEQQRVKRAVR